MAGSMALVGSYVGLSKWLVAVLPVFLLAWLRFGIAAVAMLPWTRRTPGCCSRNRARRMAFALMASATGPHEERFLDTQITV